MTLQEIADKLVAICKAGQEAANLDLLYHPDAISVEAADHSGKGRETKGLDGIRSKHAWWEANFVVHSSAVEGPFLHGDDQFAVIFQIDATEKATGQRMAMREVAVYHVAAGKIVKEAFYGMG